MTSGWAACMKRSEAFWVKVRIMSVLGEEGYSMSKRAPLSYIYPWAFGHSEKEYNIIPLFL